MNNICECCKTNHSIDYGRVRFCSVKCARSYSTKNIEDWVIMQL